MTRSTETAAVADLKLQARRLREGLREAGLHLTHSEALEMLARQHGLRDWNTLHGRASNRLLLRVGDRVRGRYLGQQFEGELRALTTLGDGSRRRVTLQFDRPVDVVRFASFSSLRSRVTGVIGWDGRSPETLSDGEPQLVLTEAF